MKRILFLAAIFLLVAAVPVEAAITTYYIRYDTTSCRADSNTAMVWAGGDTLDFVTGGDIQLRLLVAAGVELAEVHSDSALTKVRITNAATDGDAVLSFALSGTDKFTMGVDDGDSDKFKIGTTAVGTGTFVTWDGTTFTITGTLALTDGYELNTYAVESDSLTVTGYATFSGATVANLGTVSAATSITSTVFKGAIDGTVGATTPAAATVTTFTSTGIDDNATGEILQITDSGATVAGDFSATDLDGIIGSNTAAAGLFTTLGASGVLSVTDTTEATTTTAASLKTAGGLATVKDIYAGDDVFLTSGAVFNYNAGELTLTHSANSLAISSNKAGAAVFSLTNPNTGTIAQASSYVSNNVSTAMQFALTGGNYTPSGAYLADMGYITSGGAGGILIAATAAAGTVRFGSGASPTVTMTVDYANTKVVPSGNKAIDLGLAGNAWDDCVADDFVNEADYYWLDDRDDLAAICGIKPSGEVDPIHGYPLIDDATVPEWMFRRWKKSGRRVTQELEWEVEPKDAVCELDEDGNEVLDKEGNPVVVEEAVEGVVKVPEEAVEWEMGDLMWSAEGKPYFSTKLWDSVLAGAVRQLKGIVDAQANRIAVLEGAR